MSTFEAFPTWSWASRTAPISFYNVEEDAALCINIVKADLKTLHRKLFIGMKRVFVKSIGELHMEDAATTVKPFVALQGRIAEVEIEDRIWIKSFKYRARLDGFAEREPLHGQCQVFMSPTPLHMLWSCTTPVMRRLAARCSRMLDVLCLLKGMPF